MIDIVTVWPRWMDYPLFRHTVSQARAHYGRLIISWTGTDADPAVERYVQAALPWALFAPYRYHPGDWRHIATLDALAKSGARAVLFLEQDFLVRDPDGFFGRLACAAQTCGLIGFQEHGRTHPACLLVAYDLLMPTSLEFSAAGGPDHFWRVTGELEAKTELTALEALGLERGRDWHHMAGLTHNYDLVRRGLPANYRPLEFALYNLVCLRLGSCPEFAGLMERCVAGVPLQAVIFPA